MNLLGVILIKIEKSKVKFLVNDEDKKNILIQFCIKKETTTEKRNREFFFFSHA